MKKTGLLTVVLSILVVAFCLNVFADDLASQISTLEQKAERLQNLINQAKQQTSSMTDQQVKAMAGSVDNLVKQRVQLDAQIARIEGQIQEIKSSSNATLDRQVKQYDQELSETKQQMASVNAKKEIQGTQKAIGGESASLAATALAPGAAPAAGHERAGASPAVSPAAPAKPANNPCPVCPNPATSAK
jgi:DNA repair exonuclease SbcCD ATPase subunit